MGEDEQDHHACVRRAKRKRALIKAAILATGKPCQHLALTVGLPRVLSLTSRSGLSSVLSLFSLSFPLLSFHWVQSRPRCVCPQAQNRLIK